MGTKRNSNAPADCGFRNHCYPGARFCPPLVSHIVSTGDRMARKGLAAGPIRAWNAAGALKASSTVRVKLSVRVQLGFREFSHGQFWRLTMRLRGKRVRCRESKLLYLNHRASPSSQSPRAVRSNRLLGSARGRLTSNGAVNDQTHQRAPNDPNN